MVPRVKIPLFATLALCLGFVAPLARGAARPEAVALGNNTYSITCQAGTGFARDTDKLKAQALDAAAAFCTERHKELKVVSATTYKPKLMFTGYAQAKVVFKALDAGDPELTAPVSAAPSEESAPAGYQAVPERTPTDTLYNELMRLEDLRKRGILTDEEFQAQKKKVLERSK